MGLVHRRLWVLARDHSDVGSAKTLPKVHLGAGGASSVKKNKEPRQEVGGLQVMSKNWSATGRATAIDQRLVRMREGYN